MLSICSSCPGELNGSMSSAIEGAGGSDLGRLMVKVPKVPCCARGSSALLCLRGLSGRSSSRRVDCGLRRLPLAIPRSSIAGNSSREAPLLCRLNDSGFNGNDVVLDFLCRDSCLDSRREPLADDCCRLDRLDGEPSGLDASSSSSTLCRRR